MAVLALAAQTCGGELPEDRVSRASKALEGAPCTITSPEGWREAPQTSGVLSHVVEPYERENVVVRSWLALREPSRGPLEEAVRAAKAEEQLSLGERPEFELVRDGRLPLAKMSAHLLVYRYRNSAGAPVILKFHAVYSTGFRTVHAVGESQATIIDALHTPYREAGLHETLMRPALQSVRCSR
ncbi:MAG: hypothetical protein HYZ28_10690 [Myxococcales bacterium]|nr:hypothetical protein [Myxococcales bacterium]